MNDNNDTAAGTTQAVSARTFVSTNGKPLNADKPRGELKFINFKKLNDAGTTGVVAEGIYESSKVVEGGLYGPKTEYAIRADDGTLQIVTEAGGLKGQMAKVDTGSYIQITYLGKQAMESGPRKGQLAHKVIVGVSAE
jgi:hypothetical protein